MVTIYWVVDGYTGNTVFNGDKDMALLHFNFSFKPYGYKLISIN